VERCNLQLFRQSGVTHGFVLAAGRLISELQRSMIEPSQLKQGLAQWAADDRSRLLYGQEVAEIYVSYRYLLTKINRVDQDLFAWRSLDALRGKPLCWKGSPVFFYGFDDFTSLQLDAIESLALI